MRLYTDFEAWHRHRGSNSFSSSITESFENEAKIIYRFLKKIYYEGNQSGADEKGVVDR